MSNLRIIAVPVCFAFGIVILGPAPAPGQVLEKMDRMDHTQHAAHGEHHHLHLPLGEAACSPNYTYEEGALGPGHWPGLCSNGTMQAPINITQAERLPVDGLKFAYRATDLDIIDDCNEYRILVKFPDNYWLTVGKKPYNLTELHFRAPGENAVNGKRPPMSVQFVHFSPKEFS